MQMKEEKKKKKETKTHTQRRANNSGAKFNWKHLLRYHKSVQAKCIVINIIGLEFWINRELQMW